MDIVYFCLSIILGVLFVAVYRCGIIRGVKMAKGEEIKPIKETMADTVNEIKKILPESKDEKLARKRQEFIAQQLQQNVADIMNYDGNPSKSEGKMNE